MVTSETGMLCRCLEASPQAGLPEHSGGGSSLWEIHLSLDRRGCRKGNKGLTGTPHTHRRPTAFCLGGGVSLLGEKRTTLCLFQNHKSGQGPKEDLKSGG